MTGQPGEENREAARIEVAETYFLPAGSGSRHVIFPGVDSVHSRART